MVASIQLTATGEANRAWVVEESGILEKVVTGRDVVNRGRNHMGQHDEAKRVHDEAIATAKQVHDEANRVYAEAKRVHRENAANPAGEQAYTDAKRVHDEANRVHSETLAMAQRAYTEACAA